MKSMFENSDFEKKFKKCEPAKIDDAQCLNCFYEILGSNKDNSCQIKFMAASQELDCNFYTSQSFYEQMYKAFAGLIYPKEERMYDCHGSLITHSDEYDNFIFESDHF